MKVIGMASRAKALAALRAMAMAVAVVALLAALVVPHHHHRWGICVATTECHAGQDEGHGADSRRGASCIDKEAFIHAKKLPSGSTRATIGTCLATAQEATSATVAQPATELFRPEGDGPTPTPPPATNRGKRAPPRA